MLLGVRAYSMETEYGNLRGSNLSSFNTLDDEREGTQVRTPGRGCSGFPDLLTRPSVADITCCQDNPGVSAPEPLCPRAELEHT